MNELPAARRKDELDGLVREAARVKIRAAEAISVVSGLLCTGRDRRMKERREVCEEVVETPVLVLAQLPRF